MLAFSLLLPFTEDYIKSRLRQNWGKQEAIQLTHKKQSIYKWMELIEPKEI